MPGRGVAVSNSEHAHVRLCTVLFWKSATLIAISVVFLFEQTADPFGTDISSYNLLNLINVKGAKLEFESIQR
jgi:hypothetical protein